MDFIRVLIPMSGSDNAMEGEQINKYGNHVGSWNIGLTGYVQDWRIKAYYEHSLRTNHKCFLVRSLERRATGSSKSPCRKSIH